jgi:hypothetical protein
MAATSAAAPAAKAMPAAKVAAGEHRQGKRQGRRQGRPGIRATTATLAGPVKARMAATLAAAPVARATPAARAAAPRAPTPKGAAVARAEVVSKGGGSKGGESKGSGGSKGGGASKGSESKGGGSKGGESKGGGGSKGGKNRIQPSNGNFEGPAHSGPFFVRAAVRAMSAFRRSHQTTRAVFRFSDPILPSKNRSCLSKRGRSADKKPRLPRSGHVAPKLVTHQSDHCA